MTDNIFEQFIFGIYEVLSDILPGSILLMTFLLKSDLKQFEMLPDSLLILTFIFIAFIIGQIIHCIASDLEGYINQKKYGGYPSSILLSDEDTTFPKYFKDTIRQKVNKNFQTPLDSSSQHIFDICYTFVIQNKLSNRVMIFLNMYTFSRNMMVAMFIEGIILSILAYIEINLLIGLISLLSLCSPYFFYQRFDRYANSFAKEVLRSYFVYINKQFMAHKIT